MIDHTYMTEESDNGDVVHQHKLTWQSEGINDLVIALLCCGFTNTFTLIY